MRFWHKFRDYLGDAGQYLAKPHVLFYALPWLMFLTVLGTVAQKDMGLHAAVEKYFTSIILWLGPIPTPGGLTTIAVIFLALTIKFIFYSEWKWHRAGTILTHLGVLLLLIGGLLTAGTMREGFMIIPEGKALSKMADYQNRVLNFKKDGAVIETIAFDTIKNDQILTINNHEFRVLMHCDNCDARAPSGLYENLQDLAVNMELFEVPDEKNIEANFSGLIFEAITPNEAQNGTYIVMEDIPRVPKFTTNDGVLSVELTRATTPLPFEIALTDFRKIDYPGTKKAREFESDLIVRDGDVEWPATVSMNKPLRYKGYTFFQSSFDQRDGVEITVLNVVQNTGRYFPYISTLIIFAGMLLHFIIRLQQMRSRREGKEVGS